MKMSISSVETHQRVHSYRFDQRELEQLALEKVAKELGFNLPQGNLKTESRIISNSSGINPTTYECRIQIVENLDCKE
ncbi:hypothetical protein [Alkanindiges illinoisensis]|uniref:Uncharacterized protein n=1 Tax=Alkanindiges illinoisensis TaxID=197183 RepID=A0A4Y7XB62_9GAMM|nr:hypothetical protein [Alkanindiges illinoisensis]TEU24694.1 hypothetical protein E2B99_11355 [Alkanindiges illinoisensis]